MTCTRNASFDPLATWKQLTPAQRGALQRMRGGNFLYRVRNGYIARGAAHRTKLSTIRALRDKNLVHEQTLRAKNPLFLTPLGKRVVEAGAALKANRKAKQDHAASAARDKAAIAANRRHYQDVMDGCAECMNGYTFTCQTPDTCPDPTRGCHACMTKCMACYETQGVNA